MIYARRGLVLGQMRGIIWSQGCLHLLGGMYNILPRWTACDAALSESAANNVTRPLLLVPRLLGRGAWLTEDGWRKRLEWELLDAQLLRRSGQFAHLQLSGPEVLFQDLRRDEIRGWWWWWWLQHNAVLWVWGRWTNSVWGSLSPFPSLHEAEIFRRCFKDRSPNAVWEFLAHSTASRAKKKAWLFGWKT